MARKTEETLAMLRQQKAQAEKEEGAKTAALASTRARLRALGQRIAEVEASELGHLAMVAELHLVDRALVAEAFVWLGTVLAACPADLAAARTYLRGLTGEKTGGVNGTAQLPPGSWLGRHERDARRAALPHDAGASRPVESAVG